MSESSPVPVIVLAPSREPVETINSVLRRAGQPAHCTWIPSLNDLLDALTQINPELLVAWTKNPEELAEAARVRDMGAPQLPMVALDSRADEETIARAMQRGARDVVTTGNLERLEAVLMRELRSFRLERAFDNTLKSAHEYRRQLQTVLERSNDAIAQVQEGIVVGVNESWLELWGLDEDAAMVGQPLMDFFDLTSHAALKGALHAALQGQWSDHSLQVSAALADETTLPLEIVLSPGEFDGDPCVRLLVPAQRRDVSRIADELADTVKRDPLTGLLGRRAVLEAVTERAGNVATAGVRYCALIRMDKFATIERDLGLRGSDEVLARSAGVLRDHLNKKDIAGRFSGAAFLALIERGNQHDVETWATQFVAAISAQVFTHGSKTVRVTCTIGLGVVPHAEPDAEAAIMDAIEAARRARRSGGNQFYLYDRADTDSRVQAYDKIWVKHIKSALMENRFRLVQQPIANLRGEESHMLDVLVRMLDHQGKEVLPSDFIAAAERNNLMKNIDRWVIGASMSFAMQRKPRCLFVRLSRDSTLDAALPEWLDAQLKTSRSDPQRICFQITEQIAESHGQSVHMLMKLLKQRGFQLALERFGSGRHSEDLLSSMPLDFVKIDGAIIQNLRRDVDQQQLVRTLVGAAKANDVETIAERVEDANTMATLWQLGVQFIQGFFVHAPEEVVMHAER
ncbi:MAG: EAL domain-containing protein [Steroidobacteraceae bacterium]